MITRRVVLASMLTFDAFFSRKGQVNVEVERPVSVSGICFHALLQVSLGKQRKGEGWTVARHARGNS